MTADAEIADGAPGFLLREAVHRVKNRVGDGVGVHGASPFLVVPRVACFAGLRRLEISLFPFCPGLARWLF